VLDDPNDITVLLFLAAQEGDAVSVADYAPFVDDINARDDEECTPLYYAVCSQCLEAVRVLLSHGASPDCRNKSGFVPFDLTIMRNDVDMARLLVQGGANLALMSSLKPETLFELALGGIGLPKFRPLAVDWALENLSIFEKVPHAILLAIDHHVEDSKIAKLIDAGCPLSCLDEYKDSPLENAIDRALPETVGAMLRRGVDTAGADPEKFSGAWRLVYGPSDEQGKLVQIAKRLFEYCPSLFEVRVNDLSLSEGLRMARKYEVADFVERECNG
jgi:ankyrin repeat protein